MGNGQSREEDVSDGLLAYHPTSTGPTSLIRHIWCVLSVRVPMGTRTERQFYYGREKQIIMQLPINHYLPNKIMIMINGITIAS